MADKLTEKQRRFVEAYLGDAKGNGTEAARLAGYKGTHNALGVVSHENLRNPKIIGQIKENLENCPLVASKEERLKFLADVMRGDEDTRNRLRACELLGKMAGDFVERRDVNISGELQQMSTADLLRQLPSAIEALEN